jgi:hypothetical protein
VKTLFLRVLTLATCALIVSPALAQSPFDGRWRIDTSSMQITAKSTAITLTDGVFKIDNGGDDAPGTRADGVFHAVDGHGYTDETSITVTDDRHIREVDRNHGKTVYIVDYTVSPDGKRLTSSVTSYANPTGQPVHSESTQLRIDAVPPGAHAISGRWQREKVTVDPSSDWILKLEGNRFSWASLQGSGYDAVIGGKPVRLRGDSAGNFVAITMPAKDTVVESHSIPDGTVKARMSMKLFPDNKTIRADSIVLQTGAKSTFYMRKQ